MTTICPSKQRRHSRIVIAAWLLLIAALAAWLSPAAAAELRLYAAAGVKAPLEQIARDFEAATGNRVTLLFDTAGAAEQRFIADPAASFLVTTRARLQAAEKDGRLRHGVTSVIGATVGGLAAPPDGPRPAIATPEQLRAALLAAPRIAFSDPARGATVGKHFLMVIEELGIREQVLRKATLARDGVETMHLVLEGKADLGVTQISEIVQADARALLGPFPGRFDLATTYALWLSADAAPEARAFAALVTSAAERARLRAHGLRPPE